MLILNLICPLSQTLHLRNNPAKSITHLEGGGMFEALLLHGTKQLVSPYIHSIYNRFQQQQPSTVFVCLATNGYCVLYLLVLWQNHTLSTTNKEITKITF